MTHLWEVDFPKSTNFREKGFSLLWLVHSHESRNPEKYRSNREPFLIFSVEKERFFNNRYFLYRSNMGATATRTQTKQKTIKASLINPSSGFEPFGGLMATPRIAVRANSPL